MITSVSLTDLLPPGYLESLESAMIRDVLRNVAEAARSEWIRLAGERLHMTQRDYIRGIQPVEMGDGVATITLVGVLPNLLENGMTQIDMHDTLLGPNVPVATKGGRGKHLNKSGGYYRAVPFRHGTPGSQGGAGAVMGSAYGGHDLVTDAKKLGRDVYKAAKALEGSTSTPGGGTKWGGRLLPGMAPLLRSYHATDIYAGMVRNEKTYKDATQSSYQTFRTIAVDASGKPVGGSPWIRPATPGENILNDVVRFVERIGPEAFGAVIGK